MYVDLQQQLTTLQAAFEPNAIALAEAQRIARSIHKKIYKYLRIDVWKLFRFELLFFYFQ